MKATDITKEKNKDWSEVIQTFQIIALVVGFIFVVIAIVFRILAQGNGVFETAHVDKIWIAGANFLSELFNTVGGIVIIDRLGYNLLPKVAG